MSMIFMVQAMQMKVGNPARKLVLLKLADNANDNGVCWPSYETIARACEMSRRTVIRHVDDLVKDGLVSVTHRSNEKGHTSNVYKLHLHEKLQFKHGLEAANDPSDKMSPPENTDAKQDEVIHSPSEDLSLASDTGSPSLVTYDHQPSDRMSLRTSQRTSQRTSHIEPKKNKQKKDSFDFSQKHENRSIEQGASFEEPPEEKQRRERVLAQIKKFREVPK